jgi:AcrR family transcriptional regulator
MVSPRRARQPKQKAERREAIVDAAASAFAEGGFSAITMAGVAGAVGLAKGTLYLYFRSKEELFVAVLERELDGWQSELLPRLQGSTDVSPQALAADLARSILARPRMVRLLAILSPVLEANVPEETSIAFKVRLVQRMASVAPAVEARCDKLLPGEGALVLRRLDALVVGLWPMAKPGILAKQAVTEPALNPLRVDLGVELEAMLSALIVGMVAGR